MFSRRWVRSLSLGQRYSAIASLYSALDMDLADIRRIVITGMFSDDMLFRRLVLKGGNAISLVYRYGSRGSLDVDFSIEGDFDDVDDASRRILHGLKDRFDAAGYVVFDHNFAKRPSVENEQNPKWGGYRIQFKLIEKPKYEGLKKDLDTIRRNAAVVGPLQQRIFTVDISRHEFCSGKAEVDLGDFTIYVYTPSMIAIEKIRAICQQMPEYPARTTKSARARDFYDIYTVLTEAGVNLTIPESVELAKQIFAAKDVPIALISKIHDFREFHRQDWHSVQDTVAGPVETFDFYFDFLLDEIKRLESLWVI
jgi:predicted nucleotidyltransferase component of viral defense system